MHSLILTLLAQAEPPKPSPVLEAVLQYIVAPLIAIAAPILVALLAKLVQYLNSKGKESKLALVGGVVADAAHSVVAELDVTLRPKLTAALADGKLTDAEKAELKAAAVDALKTKLPASVMGGAAGIFGPLLDQWLGGMVERAVSARAVTEAAGAPPATPAPVAPFPTPLGG